MHSISIKFKDNIIESELWQAFYGLLGNLRENGLLLGRDTQAYIKDNHISATIHTFTVEGLAPQYFNDYVKKSIEKLEKLCDNSLIINYLGCGEDEATVACTCTQHDHYVIYRTDYSPIKCGSCSKAVPIFKLPKLEDQRYWNLMGWSEYARACMVLDLSCAVGEK
jgi:predicted  nucleic acid-binding Zn ribbon protein